MSETTRARPFLIKVLIFVLLPAPLLVGLHRSFHGRLKYEAYDFCRDERDYFSNSQRLDFLIAGNSRSRRGIDPRILGNAAVLSTPGESFVETYYLLEHVLRKHPRGVSTIVLPGGYGTFKPTDFRRSFFWIRYVDVVELGWREGQLGRYLTEYLRAALFPYRGLVAARVRGWLTERAGSPQVAGAVDRERGQLSAYDAATKAALLEADVRYLGTCGMQSRAAIHYLNRLLRLLEQEKVRVVFVKFPARPELLARLEVLAEEQGYEGHEIDALIRQSPAARLLDFQHLLADREELFSDHHHLNSAGAALLTRRLVEELSAAPAG